MFLKILNQSHFCDFFHENVKPNKMKLEISSSTKQGLREYQEDRVVTVPNINDRYTLFAVFDGHVGDMASEFAKNNIEKIFRHNESQKEKDMYKILYKTVEELEKSYRKSFENKQMELPEIPGTTAVIAVIDHDKNVLFVANVGDSRAILIRDNTVYQITLDHNIQTIEKARLDLMKKHKSAYVSDGYLWTEHVIEIPCNGLICPYNHDKNYALNVTRTIGDPLFKKEYNYFLIRDSIIAGDIYDIIPWYPDIYSYRIRRGDIIVLGSDGIYNFLSNVDVARMAKQKDAAESVTQAALDNESSDNVSSIVVKVI